MAESKSFLGCQIFVESVDHFLLDAHICSALKIQNYHLHWWDAIHKETMPAVSQASPHSALSVTCACVDFCKDLFRNIEVTGYLYREPVIP